MPLCPLDQKGIGLHRQFNESFEAVDVAASAFVVWPLHVLYGLGLLRS